MVSRMRVRLHLLRASKLMGSGLASMAVLVWLVLFDTTPQTHTVEAASSVPPFDHIFVIVFENHSYAEIIGNTVGARTRTIWSASMDSPLTTSQSAIRACPITSR
jgi:hypothetical protein